MIKKKNKRGFTIVELVIVIAVIGILAGILIPMFSNLIAKANLASDNALVRELNNAIAMDAEVNGKHETINDVLKTTDEYGFNVQRIVAKTSQNKILWDSKNDVFCYLKDGVVEYNSASVEEGKELSAGDYRLWVVANDVDAEYSTYLYKYTGNGVIQTDKGLDVGDEEVSSVTYAHTGLMQSVIIRTNSNLTTLTINAPGDKIYHYDEVGTVNIMSSDMASYHENGTVSFLEVAGGRVVLEETAKVFAIHFTATSGQFKNSDDKTISIDISKVAEENKPSFTRDAVTIANNGTYVAEITTNKTEHVWLFGNGIKEQMVVSSTTGAIAENGVLKSGIIAGAEDGSIAEEIANPAKRNNQGALVDNNGNVIDVSSVNWSNSDALDTVTEIVYEELKTKEDAINENVIELITTFEQLKDFVENGTKINGVIGADIDVIANIVVDRKVTLVLNGYTLSNLVNSNRSFACMNECDLTIDANIEGSKLIIPASNTSSYGFFDMKENGASVILIGGEYLGNTDNGALFKVRVPAVNIEIYDSMINTSGGGVINSVGSGMYGYIDEEDGFRKSFAYTTVTVKDTNVVHGYANDEVGNHLDISTFHIIGNAYFENVTISTAHGSGIDLNGGTNYIKNCNVTVLRKTNNASNWTGTALSCANDADVVVEGGTYLGSYYGAYVYTSNGRFTFKGNVTISGETALKVGTATSKKPSDGYRTPGIIVESGTITGALSKGTDTNLTIIGGIFSVDPSAFIDTENYIVTGDGPYTVSAK